jgi:hypothetical protein
VVTYCQIQRELTWVFVLGTVKCGMCSAVRPRVPVVDRAFSCCVQAVKNFGVVKMRGAEFVVPPWWSASSDRELLRISTIRVLINRYEVTASPPATRVVFSLLPTFFVFTVLQLDNLLSAKVGTLIKNSSEGMLRVAGIEVFKRYASLEMRNVTLRLTF